MNRDDEAKHNDHFIHGVIITKLIQMYLFFWGKCTFLGKEFLTILCCPLSEIKSSDSFRSSRSLIQRCVLLARKLATKNPYCHVGCCAVSLGVVVVGPETDLQASCLLNRCLVFYFFMLNTRDTTCK